MPYIINNYAGLGTQITVADMNSDKRPDVLTAQRKGAYLFFNNVTPRKSARRVPGEIDSNSSSSNPPEGAWLEKIWPVEADQAGSRQSSASWCELQG